MYCVFENHIYIKKKQNINIERQAIDKLVNIVTNHVTTPSMLNKEKYVFYLHYVLIHYTTTHTHH